MDTPGTPIPCLLIPMPESHDLLLPNTAVAEIMSFKAAEEVSGTPDWFLGFIRWRGQRLPLLDHAAAVGHSPMAARPERVVITNTLGEHAVRMPFLAFACRGIPRLLSINAGELRALDETPAPSTGILQAVHWAGEEIVIPDLAPLEALAWQAMMQF